MTPFRFIKLHDRNGCTEVFVNVEQIVFIRDLRSDPATRNVKGYKWTLITTTSSSVEVLETMDEILELMARLR